jgi:NADP-dependent 3-hydroxy acid dehydrogenase YdfG
MLTGRRAIVTGASGGIGAAVARTLAAAGVRSLLVARRPAPLEALAAVLPGAVACPADLALPADVARVVEDATGRLGGPVDLLVNNAGIFTLATLEATADETLDAMLALSIAAPFRLMRALLPAMRAQAVGHIVTIGSVADRSAFPENSAYSASKYGARALHEVVRQETRGSGVRATLISPAATDTPIWDPLHPETRPGFPARDQMLRPEAVADAVLWAITRAPAVNIDELRLSHA